MSDSPRTDDSSNDSGTSRRSFLVTAAASLPIAAGLAGCLGEEIEGDVVRANVEGIELTEYRSWIAGTTFEYGGAFVVRGSFRNVGPDARPVPIVTGAFFDRDGTLLVETDGDVRLPAGEAGPDAELGEEMAPSDELAFVFVVEPERPIGRYEITIG